MIDRYLGLGQVKFKCECGDECEAECVNTSRDDMRWENNHM